MKTKWNLSLFENVRRIMSEASLDDNFISTVNAEATHLAQAQLCETSLSLEKEESEVRRSDHTDNSMFTFDFRAVFWDLELLAFIVHSENPGELVVAQTALNSFSRSRAGGRTHYARK